MPRRSRLRRRSSGWSDQQVEILKTGADYFGEFQDEAEMRQAWQDLRKEILAEWLQNHAGSRPFGWWCFDAPKGSRRDCVNGRHPFDDPRFDLEKKLWYGLPQFCRECDLALQYESEASFLRRQNLCSAAELKFLNGAN
jgi:hypothetical protein